MATALTTGDAEVTEGADATGTRRSSNARKSFFAFLCALCGRAVFPRLA